MCYVAIKKSKFKHYLRTWRHFHTVLPCKKSKVQENEGNILYREIFPPIG